ncbi:MAG TPA: hypothetical protein PKE45_04655 [Caldilineaceae bacterium]|nr:hypothetical protein [Caldilineaceae bacterium]
MLRTYYARFQDSHASTQDFIALANEVSGQEPNNFFQTWFFADELPPLPATTR